MSCTLAFPDFSSSWHGWTTRAPRGWNIKGGGWSVKKRSSAARVRVPTRRKCRDLSEARGGNPIGEKKNLFVFIWNNCLTKKRAADQSNCTHWFASIKSKRRQTQVEWNYAARVVRFRRKTNQMWRRRRKLCIDSFSLFCWPWLDIVFCWYYHTTGRQLVTLLWRPHWPCRCAARCAFVADRADRLEITDGPTEKKGEETISDKGWRWKEWRQLFQIELYTEKRKRRPSSSGSIGSAGNGTRRKRGNEKSAKRRKKKVSSLFSFRCYLLVWLSPGTSRPTSRDTR